MPQTSSSPAGSATPGALLRRTLFLVALALFTLYYLFDFKGLSHPKGMEQAQIARELARDNGFSTKMIRPVAINLAAEDGDIKNVSLTDFKDTYHSPLNPLYNSLFFRLFVSEDGFLYDPGKDSLAQERDEDGNPIKQSDRQAIYFPDFIIAVASVLLFLASIGINYVLIARIFDPRIAGVTALLLVLCDLMWSFSLSGLPQMLMLFLFSFAIYFLYKAIEIAQTDKVPYLMISLMACFFGLLAFAHWITLWIFVGVLIFSAIYFKPRGVLGGIALAIFLAIVSSWLIRNSGVGQDAFGVAFYTVFSDLSGVNEATVMKTLESSQSMSIDGLGMKIVLNSLQQTNSLYSFLGSILAAPLFFISLLHPFKRKEIATFRWAILLMWCFAVVGMAFFGLQDGAKDPNQIHLLFIPIMTAYGLAVLSVLWNRMGLPTHIPIVRNGHLVLVILISALPVLLPLPKQLIAKFKTQDKISSSNIYSPATLSLLKARVPEKHVIITDMPWATAWYGDRISVWLPREPTEAREIIDLAETNQTPVEGFYITPYSFDQPLYSRIYGSYEYRKWAPLILGGMLEATGTDSRAAISRSGDTVLKQMFLEEFSLKNRLTRERAIFYSKPK